MIITIASGKGGTGKTMIATNMAMALGNEKTVQLLDCDVEAPNSHLFLKLEMSDSEPVFIKVPVIDQDKCTQCKACYNICPVGAIIVS